MRLPKSGFLALILFVFGVGMVWFTSNKTAFDYNMDAKISPYGLALSQTINELDEETRNGHMGMVLNGDFSIYANWSKYPFQLQALWYKAIGRSDIAASRLFSALVYGLNACLFFVLLIRAGKDKLVALLATVLFALLPLHLSYGGLIFSDIWFTTFCLLALLTISGGGLRYYWLYVLIVLAGSLVFWFVLFLLPAPLLFHLIKKKEVGAKNTLVAMALTVLIIWLGQWLLIKSFSEMYIVESMRKHSFFGALTNPKRYSLKLIERFSTLGYDVLVLLPFILFHKKWKQLMTSVWNNRLQDPLTQLLMMLVISYILYIAAFTQWFAGHEQGVGMFSVCIAGIAALMIEEVRTYSLRNEFLVRTTGSVLLSLLLFFSLSFVQYNADDTEIQDQHIVQFINQSKTGNDKRVCLFFDMTEYERYQLKIATFAIREHTNAYTFNIHEMPEQEGMAQTVHFGMEKIRAKGFKNVDVSSAYLVTNKLRNLEKLNVLDSTQINEVRVYQIDL